MAAHLVAAIPLEASSQTAARASFSSRLLRATLAVVVALALDGAQAAAMVGSLMGAGVAVDLGPSLKISGSEGRAT